MNINVQVGGNVHLKEEKEKIFKIYFSSNRVNTHFFPALSLVIQYMSKLKARLIPKYSIT